MSEVVVPAIRLATVADAATLAELGARTFAEAFASENRPEDIASHLAATYGTAQQTEELADARSTFFIAEVDGVAVGYAMLYVRGLAAISVMRPARPPGARAA